ncbi:MAG: hypothetical protein L0H79_03940 [Intrasporangium sp.]|uniref:hypothetical protein n=1 Tax=Intrasporangium sp. TaxID=1925024 RepID=UPI0026479D46|nr:hypothetical protein [Intrasporangium sp.]MDN5794885.1 hypothetical protein [Intrasporangium sp.]
MSDTPTQEHQLELLESAREQQTSALGQMREAALENAKYWEGLADQSGSKLPQPSPSAWVTAHFDYLDTVTNAQFQYARALVTASSKPRDE